MKPLVIAGALVGLWVGGLLDLALARAEQVEIVTYYPSPSATTDDLRVKRATVGSGYKALNLDDPLATIPDGSLLVEGSIGIGTSAPPLQAPDGSTAGNLNVNNIFIRSLNSGAGLWASEVFADNLAPPKPYTATVLVPEISNDPAGGVTAHAWDLYTMLQLWRYGVTRDQMSLVDWNFVYLSAPGPPATIVTLVRTKDDRYHSSEYFRIFNGVVYYGWYGGNVSAPSYYAEITVTW